MSRADILAADDGLSRFSGGEAHVNLKDCLIAFAATTKGFERAGR